MRLRWLALVLLLFAASACQAGGTRPIIKIGLTAPFTGFDQAVGYSVIGAVRLAVRERNLSGGVAGYSIELVALDDGNLPDMAAQRARELIIDPAVMGVLGGFDELAASAAAQRFEQAGMPFVSLAAGDGLGEQVFRLVGRPSEAGAQAARAAVRDVVAPRIAMISDGTPGEAALAQSFAAAAQAGGARIVYSGQVQRWQLDFSTLVRELEQTRPDLVFFAGRAAEAGVLLKEMRAAGVAAAFLGGPGVDDARLLQIAGAAAARDARYVSLGYALPQVTDAAARQRLAAASLRPAGAYTVLAYDGAHLLLDALASAIKVTGKPSRAALAGALRSIRYQGLSGEISFDAQGVRRVAPVSLFRIDNAYPGVELP